jgi:hypothetical protein
MSHEVSETVQRADGRWINVYGRGLPQAGQRLPGSGDYDTAEEAVEAAQLFRALELKRWINLKMPPPGPGKISPRPLPGSVRGMLPNAPPSLAAGMLPFLRARS